jgi:hypothetical protein
VNEALEQIPENLVIPTGADSRLLIRQWENANGQRFVTVAPQYLHYGGEWRLNHSGLILAPDAARELAPALLAIAAAIDGSPPEPEPTDQDRELSRMP